MILNYKKTSVWIIQYGKMIEAKKDKEGKSIQESVFSGQGIRIIPGLNKIKDEVWSTISKHPDVKKKLESGLLEIVEEGASKSGGKNQESGDIESLAGFDPSKAISVVEGQMDAAVLSVWKRKEKRATVLKAIKDQLERVSKADKAFEGKD